MGVSWIVFTLMAAFMQAWRNAFQKQLSITVDVYGVTFARFIFALPFAGLYLYSLYHQYPVQEPVTFTTKFWVYVSIAALSQILATILIVQLFKQRNYAIGVGLAKSEAILAAIIAFIFLSETLSLIAWLGVLMGGYAVFLLSKAPNQQKLSVKTLMIGVGSGLSFAITSLLVREASLEITQLPVLHRASWVLFTVISIQCTVMLTYLSLFSRQTLWAMWQRVGLTFKISVCSFLASLGWFTAMSLQTVAIVKTLGQIEVLFSLLISAYFFKEKLAAKDKCGILFVVIAAILVMTM